MCTCCKHVYIYICMYIHMNMFIYIYIYRERDIHMYVYKYACMDISLSLSLCWGLNRSIPSPGRGLSRFTGDWTHSPGIDFIPVLPRPSWYLTCGIDFSQMFVLAWSLDRNILNICCWNIRWSSVFRVCIVRHGCRVACVGIVIYSHASLLLELGKN